ncbi:CerR family C-terminal domain-containing protein [Pseudooceanicola sp.]|uniref:CerR family C-terminal domain-containing protein n=1 Tax=Pseudooceanicola sp. TaxID=1914328 RepID=UPI00261075CA|nr:CerR family C-terminal domain-containing protein [Pseudooceanicola sp.]MDF1855295.1 CerR family C-terminal domain-containing protein [Pseudooceanicola sp.]
MTTTPQKPKTDASLIQAGLQLFGRKGFEGTSTRELAAHANTNVASIAYHFGGKAGLRAACVKSVADLIAGLLDAESAPQPPATAEAAQNQIERMVGALVRLVVGTPQAQDMVTFMLRELTDQGDAVDVIYAEFLEPRHRAICDLWAKATGRDPEDEAVKLAIFAMIGQILYFRVAQPLVARRMGWDGIGPDETRRVADLVIANLRDTLERHRHD